MLGWVLWRREDKEEYVRAFPVRGAECDRKPRYADHDAYLIQPLDLLDARGADAAEDGLCRYRDKESAMKVLSFGEVLFDISEDSCTLGGQR